MIEDLYELIGGRNVVNAATERFYKRVLGDERLRHFFEGLRSSISGPARLCSFPCCWVDGCIQARIFTRLTLGPESEV